MKRISEAAQWTLLTTAVWFVRHWVVTSAIGLAVAFAAASLLVDASLGGIASPAATSLPLLKKRAADEPPLL